MDLREKVALAIAETYNDCDKFMVRSNRLKVADSILAIPEIREALALFGPDLTDTPAKDIGEAVAPRAKPDS